MIILLMDIVISLLYFLVLLVCIAVYTLIERKILSKIQRRVGPNIQGIFGIMQPFLDGIKLLLKENIIPSYANKYLYLISPMITLGLSFSFWAVIPLSEISIISDIDLSVLYIFIVSGLGVYGIICAGWASNSKYAFLGALRSAAQMVSYEVCIGIIVIAVLLCSQDYNLIEIIEVQRFCWLIIPLYPIFFMFIFVILAETNRSPFDLPEAEAELVSGYNTEYGGMGFALFFIGEYGNIIVMSFLTIIFFVGGYYICSYINIIVYYLKVCFMLFLFIWVRAAFPRFRYDQLMRLGWKVFLPVSISSLVFSSSLFTV